jgi:hypothetical protein
MLKDHDIRASVDERNEKIGRKIRDAELSKIPFMLIIGRERSRGQHHQRARARQGDMGAMTPPVQGTGGRASRSTTCWFCPYVRSINNARLATRPPFRPWDPPVRAPPAPPPVAG